MPEALPKPTTEPSKVDIKAEVAKGDWKTDPSTHFEQRASFSVAQWVLVIFAGVYLLGFACTLWLINKPDATFEKGSELVKFLVQSPIPLVTLAVGYYLSDRNRQLAGKAGK